MEEWFATDAKGGPAPTCGEATAVVVSQKCSRRHGAAVAVVLTHLILSRRGLALVKPDLASVLGTIRFSRPTGN